MNTQKNYKTRFITAASLFDGHDAAINIMRRILLSQGAEVIHLGHNRSAGEIAQAALQEDVQGIAISSYQGGHVEFFKYIIDLLKENNASHIKVFGGGGGTITAAEITELEKYGVTKIYSPEDGRKMGLVGMIEHMIKACTQNPLDSLQEKRLLNFQKDPIGLAQALTCIEQGESVLKNSPQASLWKKFQEILKKSPPSQTTVIGMTGTGGAGKSSLTDELIQRFLNLDPKTRIAVLAVDPTRQKTGGALLGDRLRMNSLQNPRAYMRSYATREANVSLSVATKEALGVLKHAGFDWIFLETGGIGQSDTAVTEFADINLYVMTAEFGAPTQLEKIGMLDYADIVVLNKMDKVGALDAITEVRKAFRRNHRQFENLSLDKYPVFGTMASHFGDPGVNSVFRHLLELKTVKEKRKALSFDYQIDGKNHSLIPPSRKNHLSEIVQSIRDYREKVARYEEKLKTVESLETTLKMEISESSKGNLKSILDKEKSALDPELTAMAQDFAKTEKAYQGDTYSFQVRDKTHTFPLTFKSLSDSAIRKIALPSFHSAIDKFRFLALENFPGHFPFTAGVFPFKRAEEDPKRMFAGEGTPTRTNKRFHFLCENEKAKRLSTAFDSVTLYGEDPDKRPDIYGKIGESGVSICSLEDMKKLYAGFDLCDPSTSVSMTINGPAPIILAFFFNTAIDQQIEKYIKETGKKPSPVEIKKIQDTTLTQVRGTVQADILKEDQAQNTCIFSTEFALRMMGDVQQFFTNNGIRNYYSVSISGYHIAEAGANPISQLAFTLANGFTYVEYYLARGMKIDDFAPNFSFFFSNALDPEYAVIGRVARRIWAIAMKYRYGASERSQKLKYHIQTSGRSLHAQEISFNDIRTTLQALYAYFDNCNSLHTNAYDEAVTTPTTESVRRAMAIQLILAKEFGWAKNENPHQGSFFIDELTDLVEKAVLDEFERISLRGGVLGAMEGQYQRSKIQEESMHYEHLKHSGELPLIGVNSYLNPQESEPVFSGELTRASYDEKNEQIKNLQDFQKRHAAEVPAALEKLKKTALRGGNVFEALLETSRVCSLGQMSKALYEIGGQYRRSV